MSKTVCTSCFRHCALADGEIGFCRARTARNGSVICSNYGDFTSIACDPIEKKPLARFFPGRSILSVGSYGCNLRCPFCQNYEISWSQEAMRYADRAELVTPEQIAETAQYYRRKVHRSQKMCSIDLQRVCCLFSRSFFSCVFIIYT